MGFFPHLLCIFNDHLVSYFTSNLKTVYFSQDIFFLGFLTSSITGEYFLQFEMNAQCSYRSDLKYQP